MAKRKLPPNEVVVREYRSGMSAGEIAEKYGVKPVTVHSCLVRIGEPRRSCAEAARIRVERGRCNSANYWQGKQQPPEMVEKRISKIRGENHWLWKGGKSRRSYRRVIKKVKCATCDSRLNLCIHHRDFDHYNNDPANLQVLCVSCHLSLHKTAYWEAVRTDKEPLRSNCERNYALDKPGIMTDNTITTYQEMSAEVEAQLYCEMVNAGKPVASMQVPSSFAIGVEMQCKAEGCLTFTEYCEAAPGWCVVFIYKESFMADVIKHSRQMTDASPLEIWFKGCMYGYPLAAIKEMVEQIATRDDSVLCEGCH